MTPAHLLRDVSQAGGYVTADGGDLVLKAPQPLPDALLAELKLNKAEVLAVLRFQDETEDLHEHFNERAGILELSKQISQSHRSRGQTSKGED